MSSLTMTALPQLIVTTGQRDKVPYNQMDPALRRCIQAHFPTEGGPVPGGPGREGWTFELIPVEGGVYFTISHKKVAAIVATVAWKAVGVERLWPWMEKHHLAFYEEAVKKDGHNLPDMAASLPQPGKELPWLAVIILPSMLIPHFNAYQTWVSKFIPAVAWAILDKRKEFKVTEE